MLGLCYQFPGLGRRRQIGLVVTRVEFGPAAACRSAGHALADDGSVPVTTETSAGHRLEGDALVFWPLALIS